MMIDFHWSHITRTFHPVGQGAFYSERHTKQGVFYSGNTMNFNIVYDCGEWKQSKHAQSVVSTAFSKEEDIDVLFISHFDWDHVSTISTLISSTKSIRTVVLPLLTKKEKSLLINFNRVLSLGILELIDDPKSFFGPTTNFIYVRSDSDRDYTEEDNEGIDLQDFSQSNSNSITINSGTPLEIGNASKWFFVPYNHKDTERKKELLEALQIRGFNINRLENDSNYTLGKSTDRNTRKELRSIYDSLSGKINENSMLLYSGPSNIRSRDCILISEFVGDELDCTYSSSYKAGCIYTGDCDSNKVQLGSVYSRFIDYIGVIQIPHHGSKYDFNIDVFKAFDSLICPVSYGTKNTHEHPAAEVINTLSLNHFRPILINEQLNSIFRQRICCFEIKRNKNLSKV